MTEDHRDDVERPRVLPVARRQSTDPNDMSRSVCYCGHPRFYDYKHDDGSCPCLA